MAEGLDEWGLALGGLAPIGIGIFVFCTFCIGMSETTRFAGSEECVLYSESHDVTVFENVCFACWSKFLSRE